MKLILVRHTSLDIEQGICYGQYDVLPGKNFEIEAGQVKNNLEYYSPDVTFCSPLKRCTMLAKACGFNDIILENRLLELNFGDWELLRWDNIHGEYAAKWMENYQTYPTPNGESMQDLIQRISDFIYELKQNDYQVVLCFTHSGPIRIFAHLLDNLSLDTLFDFKVEYGGIYEFEVNKISS